MSWAKRMTAWARGSGRIGDAPVGKVGLARLKSLTEAQQARVRDLIEAGKADADIAFSLGVTRGQVYNYRCKLKKAKV